MVYIAGSENVLADALSCIYSNDSSGTIRARSEHTYHDVVDDDTALTGAVDVTLPVLAGIEARVATRRGTRDRRPSQKVADMALTASIPPRTSTGTAKKRRSVLHGPRAPDESTEGGSTEHRPVPTQEPTVAIPEPTTTEPIGPVEPVMNTSANFDFRP